MSGEPPEGLAAPGVATAGLLAPTDVESRDDVVSTERMPVTFPPDADGPPEIKRFLSPPPSADRVSEVPPSSTPAARRRSRRTVRIPTEAAPERTAEVAAPPPGLGAANPPLTDALMAAAPVAATPLARAPMTDGALDWDAAPPAAPLDAVAAVDAVADDPDDTRATAVSAPRAGSPVTVAGRHPSDRVRTAPTPSAIPPSPPVPVMPSHRSAPTLRAVPRPAPKTLTVEPPPPVPPPVVEALPAPDESSEMIRPMRIINIGPSQPPPADLSARPPTGISQPPPALRVDGEAHHSPLPPVASKPPKPPAVEEVDAIEEEDEAVADTEPAMVARGSTTEEIEPMPLDEEEDELHAERLSDADIGSHTDDDEVPVDLDDLSPRKPPPPPPKRPTSIPPPASDAPKQAPISTSGPPPPPPPRGTDAAPLVPPPLVVAAVLASVAPLTAAAAAAPTGPPAAPTIDMASRKRVKPWWEEIFSDDYIRTLEKVDHKVIRKECDFIEERLGLEKGAVMLDLACGSGDHAVELATRGYNVVGYDLSLAMLARAQDEAQERGQKINFLQGDMREMAFDEAFDGMYSWSTSFGYFDDEKNLDVLTRVRRGLRQGGIFLLDVINRDYVCPRQPSLVWFEGDGCVCMDEMHVDFFTSRLRVKRTVMFDDGRSRECEYGIRLYGLHELGKMLHDTGFKVVEVTGHPAHPGVFFGSESPRIIVLAERA